MFGLNSAVVQAGRRYVRGEATPVERCDMGQLRARRQVASHGVYASVRVTDARLP